MKQFTLTVVIPVYNEHLIICSCVGRVVAILEQEKVNYKIILVDDGSTDTTWDEILSLSEENSKINAIRLSRNFGKENAICAGLDAVTSDCCIIMDGDLQHPPEYIPEMLKKWQTENCNIVECIKVFRGDELRINRIGARLFYKTFNLLCGINLENATDFRLLDYRVLQAWKSMPERETFFRAMSSWVGFNRGIIPIEILRRSNGKSKWRVSALIGLAIKAITSFSAIPLYIVTFLGFVFLIGALILGIQTLVRKIMGFSDVGFTTVILLLLIVGSIIMISLGIIGTYIAKIYNEVKQRPRYIIAQTVGNKEGLNDQSK